MAHDDPARAALLPRLGAALLEAGPPRGRRGRAHRGDRTRSRRRACWTRAHASSASWCASRPGRQRRSPSTERDRGLGAGACSRRTATSSASAARLGCARCTRGSRGNLARADEDWERAAEHARQADDQPALFEILGWRASAALFGPTPVPEAIARCREIREQVAQQPRRRGPDVQPLAALHAMAGDFEEARPPGSRRRRDPRRARRACTRRSRSRRRWWRCSPAGRGRPRPAARGYEALEAMGEKALLATTAAMLAQALYAQGRYDEAAELCRGQRGGGRRGGRVGAGRLAGRAGEAARPARAAPRRARRWLRGRRGWPSGPTS